MYEIEFYEDKNGKSEVVDLIKGLHYAYYKDKKFIILHHFIKKTQKTPKREIEQAKRNLQDYLERNG